MSATNYDIIIAGAGLAGGTAGYFLSKKYKALVLEKNSVPSGASNSAAGLVQTFMSRKARPAWRMKEAWLTFLGLVEEAGLDTTFSHSGVLRPAQSEKQAEFFKEAAVNYPNHCVWTDPKETAREYQPVVAPFGALYVRPAGTVNVSEFVETICESAVEDHGLDVHLNEAIVAWESSDLGVSVTTTKGSYKAKKLIVAGGRGVLSFEELSRLNLHPLKGQLVRVKCPDALRYLPPLSGSGYIVADGDDLLLGSSYEHGVVSLEPNPEKTAEIIDKTSKLIPQIADSEILEVTTGIRITVPGTHRLPMLGPLPNRKNVWLFTGLGSKGLLMAPLLSKNLLTWINAPESLPDELLVK